MQTGLTQMESYISSGEFQLQAAREQLESEKIRFCQDSVRLKMPKKGLLMEKNRSRPE